MRRRIVIDDMEIPSIQRGVLQHCLDSLTLPNLEVCWLRQVLSAAPSRWGVKKEVANALWGRVWALTGGSSVDLVLYLDGNCLVERNLQSVLAVPPAALMSGHVAGPCRLVDLDWFIVNRDLPDWVRLRSDLRQAARHYDALADFVVEVAPFVFEQSPGPNSSGIISLTPLSSRPWLNVYAPMASTWAAQLHQALDEKVISLQAITSDVANGLVRPSLGFQVHHRLDATALPETILDVDRNFVSPEIAVPLRQREFLLSRRLALRNRVNFALRSFKKNPYGYLQHQVAGLRKQAKRFVRQVRQSRFGLTTIRDTRKHVVRRIQSVVQKGAQVAPPRVSRWVKGVALRFADKIR